MTMRQRASLVLANGATPGSSHPRPKARLHRGADAAPPKGAGRFKSTSHYSFWLTLLLGGCAVGPHYVPPDVAEIRLTSPQAAQLVGVEASMPAQWWTFFEDDALSRQIETALAHNHDLRRAYANLLTARALFDQRQWERLPGVDVNLDHTRSIQQQGGANGPERVASRPWRAALDVQWEIDLFGRLARLSQSAQAQAEASAADLANLRLAIAAEVAQSWFEVQGLQRRLQVSRQEVASWSETVRLLESSVQAGVGLPDELENALSNLRRSEAGIAPLTAALQQARYRLDVLRGQRPGEGTNAGTEQAAAPAAPLITQLPLGDVNQLIRQRPDVIRAERLLAASVHDTAAATADLYPRLNLGGFIGLFALRDADIGAAARAFAITPALNFPLLQHGSARARLRAAEAQSQGALAIYEQTLLRAQEEVENAVTQLVEQQRQLASLMQAAQHAQAALDIADQRYRAGAGSYQSVLENQRTLFQLRHQVTDVETLSSVHVVTLYKALGWGKEAMNG